MRVVGGRWRGRTLDAPAGRAGTRPTTDRTRESIASTVLSARGLDLAGARVLDAFAGSGALGFELLSRGAARATFVDSSRPALACLRRNAARLGVGKDEATIVAGDVYRLAARRLPGAPFSVLLLDPPYALDAASVGGLVVSLRETGQLETDALVVYEHDVATPGLDAEGVGAIVLRRRAHGTTAVEVLRMTPTGVGGAGTTAAGDDGHERLELP